MILIGRSKRVNTTLVPKSNTEVTAPPEAFKRRSLRNSREPSRVLERLSSILCATLGIGVPAMLEDLVILTGTNLSTARCQVNRQIVFSSITLVTSVRVVAEIRLLSKYKHYHRWSEAPFSPERHSTFLSSADSVSVWTPPSRLLPRPKKRRRRARPGSASGPASGPDI